MFHRWLRLVSGKRTSSFVLSGEDKREAKLSNVIAIAAVLKKGFFLRQTAKEAGVLINAVRKVKDALEKKDR